MIRDNYNFEIKSNMRQFNSWGHYINTKKHIFRRSKKYEKIDFEMEILKESSNKPKSLNNIYHIVGEVFPTSGNYEELETLSDEEIIEELKKYYLFLSNDNNLKIFDSTIVYGEVEPGEIMFPCIHLIIEIN